MKKFFSAVFVLAVFSTLLGAAAPDRFQLFFSDAYLIVSNPSLSLQVITNGNVLSYGSDWQKARVHPYLYHLRQNVWKGFYFKVNTSRREAYLVEGSNFGKIGDVSERKLPFGVTVNGGSDTVPPDSFLINFGRDGCYLVYAPAGGNLQIAAVTDMAPEYPAVVLSYGGDWQVCKLNDQLYDFRQQFWSGFFWRVDTALPGLGRIAGGSFCKAGGQQEKLRARVNVVGGEEAERPQFQAPKPLSPRCGTLMTNFPRTFAMKWTSMGAAASYDVEVDCFHCRKKDHWDFEVGGAFMIKDINTTETTFTFWGDNRGRWRVRAKTGKLISEWSPWCDFEFRTGSAASEKADLVIRIERCPGRARPGTELRESFRVIVRNRSDRRLENIPVDIVLRSSADCSPSPGFAIYSPNYSDGVLLKGGREHITLGPNESHSVKLNGSNQIPADVRPGSYYLCVIVDPANSVEETNENNNCACCRVRIEPAAKMM